jgi:hypothetical protein
VVEVKKSVKEKFVKPLRKPLDPGPLNIVGIQYKVSTKCPPGNFGLADSGSSTITIHPNISDSQQGDTFLHETIHSLSHVLCLGLAELTVGRLAAGLHQAMTSNPKLFHRLVDGKRLV